MTVDALTIKKWRRKAGGLKHGYRLSKRKICKTVANEFNAPLTQIRYHLFDKDRIRPGFYDLRYKRLVRHIDRLLPKVFNGELVLSLKEISTGIENLEGIHIKERTLEKLFGKYEESSNSPIIVKTKTYNYRINSLHYKN